MSAWLRAAAEDRIGRRQRGKPFASVDELNEFFAECDARAGPEPEPDWEEHLAIINESRRSSDLPLP